jgi:hypothetical protein
MPTSIQRECDFHWENFKSRLTSEELDTYLAEISKNSYPMSDEEFEEYDKQYEYQTELFKPFTINNIDYYLRGYLRESEYSVCFDLNISNGGSIVYLAHLYVDKNNEFPPKFIDVHYYPHPKGREITETLQNQGFDNPTNLLKFLNYYT